MMGACCFGKYNVKRNKFVVYFLSFHQLGLVVAMSVLSHIFLFCFLRGGFKKNPAKMNLLN